MQKGGELLVNVNIVVYGKEIIILDM